jgi:hypothetical protein
MSNEQPISRSIHGLLPTEVDGFDSLAKLALDMRWPWNHATDGVRCCSAAMNFIARKAATTTLTVGITFHEASEGLFAAGDEPPCEDSFSYHLSSRSSAVLVARQAEIE